MQVRANPGHPLCDGVAPAFRDVHDALWHLPGLPCYCTAPVRPLYCSPVGDGGGAAGAGEHLCALLLEVGVRVRHLNAQLQYKRQYGGSTRAVQHIATMRKDHV